MHARLELHHPLAIFLVTSTLASLASGTAAVASPPPDSGASPVPAALASREPAAAASHNVPGADRSASSEPARAASAAGDDVRDAIARALDFTVTIEDGTYYGAGVLVAPAAGLVLTAQHVLEDMRTPRVIFVDGRSVAARVVDSDRSLDIALLQIPPQRGAAPVLGDATRLRPGEEVYAVGCPRHLGFTVSRGIVSFVGRALDGARWLQTDLPINDGNSGGPVINSRGELVGIMSFIYRRAQGLSFALPANYAASRFAQALRPPATDPDYLARFHRWSSQVGPSASATSLPR